MDIRYSRLGGLALLGLSGSAVALEFTVVLDNIGPQPLSPTFMATTNANWDNFTAGLAAPARIEQIAEDGPTSIAQMDAMAGQVAGDILDWLVFPGGPIMPGESRMATIEATLSHRWFQYASMLGMSNDAFIGSGLGVGDQQIDLFQNGVATSFDFTVSFLDAWDAGTEENTELAEHLGAFGNPGVGSAENGVIRAPHDGLRGDGAIPISFNWYGGDIARIRITPVPEPATLAGLTAGALALLRRRRR